MDKKSLGNLGESAVERYLTEHGCFIVEKNYHATQGYRDEIDLIACDGSCILFVEVKTRRESANKPADFSAPFAVTAQKKKRIVRCARLLLLNHSSYACYQPRFDVACVSAQGETITKLEYYPNAFSAEEA